MCLVETENIINQNRESPVENKDNIPSLLNDMSDP